MLDTMKSASFRARLAQLYTRNGCLRAPNPMRLNDPSYKKGYEIRLVADDKIELRHIRSALEQAGFELAKAYAKNEFQWVQPIYGREQVEQFFEVCQLEMPDALTATPTSPNAARTHPSPPHATACADVR